MQCIIEVFVHRLPSNIWCNISMLLSLLVLFDESNFWNICGIKNFSVTSFSLCSGDAWVSASTGAENSGGGFWSKTGLWVQTWSSFTGMFSLNIWINMDHFCHYWAAAAWTKEKLYWMLLIFTLFALHKMHVLMHSDANFAEGDGCNVATVLNQSFKHCSSS